MSELKYDAGDRGSVVACVIAGLKERGERLPEEVPQLSDDLVPRLVEEWITLRKPYKPRRSAPKFEEMPFGYLMVRSRDFHNGNGYLGSMMHNRMMADFLTEEGGPREGSWMNTPKFRSAREEILKAEGQLKSGDLFQKIDTMALLSLSGASAAIDAWRRALRNSP